MNDAITMTTTPTVEGRRIVYEVLVVSSSSLAIGGAGVERLRCGFGGVGFVGLWWTGQTTFSLHLILISTIAPELVERERHLAALK